jgi:serine/threonine protein kinase
MSDTVAPTTHCWICPQCGASHGDDMRFCPNDGLSLRPQGTGQDLVGRVLGERYRVLRPLGRGGMGRVYLAEHVKMKRYSAVKVLHPTWASDPDALGRFHREASNTGRISHPHVASTHDFGETEDGYVYLAMEYIEGDSLAAILRRDRVLPPRRVAVIIRQTADALDAAHHLGIVHRDLKPDNIMVVTTRDGQDHVKVVDFGIAKAVDRQEQQITSPGTAGGTPAYMSPEQLAGEELDLRTDIYSLALVAYALLAGRSPFPPANSRATLAKRLTDPPLTLSELSPQVPWPGRLQQVLDRALATERDHRYESATTFAREFEAALGLMTARASVKVKTKEISVLPESRHERGSFASWKVGRIRPGAASLALLALAGIWFWSRAGSVPAEETLRENARVGPVLAAPAEPTISEDTPTPTPFDQLRADPPSADQTPAFTQRRAPVAAAQPSASPAPPPTPSFAEGAVAAIRSAATAITTDLDIAERRARAGEYEGAWVRFWSAERRLERLIGEHPNATESSALRDRLEQARSAARTACVAEREMANRRGESPPQCQ